MKECFLSIDVECATVGRGHNDRRPCRIAMVDYNGKKLFDEIAKVPGLADPLIGVLTVFANCCQFMQMSSEIFQCDPN